MEDLQVLKKQILNEITNASDLQGLENVRVSTLGKSGSVSQLMHSLGQMSVDEKREKGALFNELRNLVAEALSERKVELEQSELNARLVNEKLDVTLSARPSTFGKIHPFSQTLYEVVEIFKGMGFDVAEGPTIESEYYNFSALNIPPEHPARQEQDTFFLPPAHDGSQMVLRTQTSPVQIRTMLKSKPPIRVIAPGRTFRSDSDQTHTPVFHQIEGLYIDESIHMGHLKGCLIEFFEKFFNVEHLPARFRPGFFPFTEPSAEMEVGCSRVDGELKIGGGDSWLEILGCGMVHPKVLENVGLDPNKYQGFAFGMGLERITMLKYGLPDLRAFYETDLRWIRHYGFSHANSLNGENV